MDMPVKQRLVALAALVVFVAVAFGMAPLVASVFPGADMSEALGEESVGPGVLAAVELYLVLCVTAVLPAFLFTAWLRSRGGPLAALGFKGSEAGRRFGSGVLGGSALILVLCAVLAGAGWYTISIGQATTTGIAVLIGLTFAALYEELLFRGFGYWALATGGGHALAIVASSILFAIAHSDNSGAHWLGMINTALAGVLLAVLRWRSGSLWTAWGVHLGWNAALGLLFGAKTSGFAFAGRLLEAEVTVVGARHVALAGGAYGPEGSVVLTPMLLAWIVWLVRTRPPKLASTTLG